MAEARRPDKICTCDPMLLAHLAAAHISYSSVTSPGMPLQAGQ